MSAEESFPRELLATDFVTTLWSVVLLAGNEESAGAAAALDKLARTYWYPLYVFARRSGHDTDGARDLTQSFFLHLLETRLVAKADPSLGRFRTYLLTSFKNFIRQEWQRARAQKRGGGMEHLSIDAQEAETRYGMEPIDLQSADKLFEHRWAVQLVERVLQKLEEEMREAGKGALFERLQGFLVGDRDQGGYAEAARVLGQTEGALRVAVHRLRQRYRELFHEEVAQTVSSPQGFEEEMQHLLQVLSG
jgi:RNA polymerase sigma-70 factor (ECF subfamily)